MCLLFDIKRYAVNDGPGIRITLFMKGCPLSCLWCHNPEGISPEKERMYNRRKCIGCRQCVRRCPTQALSLSTEGIVTDNSRCRLCGACAEVCPAMAMEMAGVTYSADYLIGEIEKEIIFMDQSGGGVSFCGGEPLMHVGALTELLRRCGALGVHRVVDTSLYASANVLRAVMEETDLFLVDLKMMDSGRHRQFCGVPNERILDNLRLLSSSGKAFSIRIPLIEGINADEENMLLSAAYLSSLDCPPLSVHLLPYHDIARGKHERLGTAYNPTEQPMAPPTAEKLALWQSAFLAHGLVAMVGG